MTHLVISLQDALEAMPEFCGRVRLQLALELVHGVPRAEGSHEELADLANGGRIVDDVQRLGVDTHPMGWIGMRPRSVLSGLP